METINVYCHIFQVQEITMKSKELQQQPQTTPTLTSFECDQSQNALSGGNQSVELQQEAERFSASGAENILGNVNTGVLLMPSTHCASVPSFGQLLEDSEKNFVDALFEGTWRSVNPIGSDDLDRKVSSAESIDSEISSTCLDAVTSLEDVFDDLVESVLDEMGDFGPGIEGITSSSATTSYSFSARPGIPVPISGSFNAQTIPSVDKHPLYRNDNWYQLPKPSCHSVGNSFQGFNFGLVAGLQNPSRGLITVMRKLCDLLAKPRSDHLDSVFVRLLNNTVKEMEDVSKPQPRRSRKKVAERQCVFKRQKKNPRVYPIDNQSRSEPSRIVPRNSYFLPLRCHSYMPAVSNAEGIPIATVDLTSEEDNAKGNCRPSQDGPLIALEDTVSNFMGGSFH